MAIRKEDLSPRLNRGGEIIRVQPHLRIEVVKPQTDVVSPIPLPFSAATNQTIHPTMSEETKRRISEAKKGKKLSAEAREHIKLGHLGLRASREKRQSQSLGAKRAWQDETKYVTARGRTLSQDHRENIANALRQRTLDRELLQIASEKGVLTQVLSQTEIALVTRYIYQRGRRQNPSDRLLSLLNKLSIAVANSC